MKEKLTTRFPITTVAKKNGMQEASPTSMQSHIDSIHSPHKTRNTIINECMKSVKFHLGSSPSGNLLTLSKKLKNEFRNNSNMEKIGNLGGVKSIIRTA